MESPCDALLPSGNFPENICLRWWVEQDFLLPVHTRDAQNMTPLKISSILHPSPWDKRPWDPVWALACLQDPSGAFGRRTVDLLLGSSANGPEFPSLLPVLPKSLQTHSLALGPWASPFCWQGPTCSLVHGGRGAWCPPCAVQLYHSTRLSLRSVHRHLLGTCVWWAFRHQNAAENRVMLFQPHGNLNV